MTSRKKVKQINNKSNYVVLDFLFKHKIINVFMACTTYFSLCKQNTIATYDTRSWLIFFLMVYTFVKTDLIVKEHKKAVFIYSLVFTFLLVFGGIVYNTQIVQSINVFKEMFSPKYYLNYIGDFLLIYILLINLFPYLFKSIKKSSTFKYFSSKNVFFISFIIIFLSWMIYFISYYPGLLTPDSFASIDMAMNKAPLSNHHPMVYSAIIIALIRLCMFIFNDLNISIAMALIFQMIVMASIFAYAITYSYKQKANITLIILMLMIYAFVPIFGFYSITMWKDIMFGGFALLLTIQAHKIYKLDKEGTITIKDLIPFIIISLLCLFFRNNAIYMYLIFIIIMLLSYKKHIELLFISFAVVLGVYNIVEGPVFKHFHVQKTESAEYIAMPLQMIGRMAFKEVKFTKGEEKLINKLIPVKTMKISYTPRVSDGIKFSPEYNASVFDKNKGAYFKLWLKLVFKHPLIAGEAYANSTLGYWFPGIYYWAAATNSYSLNTYGITNTALSKSVKNYTLALESRETPILNIEWSIGLCFWFISILLYAAIKKYGKKIITVYFPVLGIWFTLMAASPVFGEFRYAFCAFTCLPFYITLNFLEKKSSTK